MAIETGPKRQLARVTLVTDEGRSAFVEFPDGTRATVSATEPLAVDKGAVILIGPDSITQAPAELWPEEGWVGVIKLRLGDDSLIDIGGRLRLVHGGAEHGVGYTVLGRDSIGVERVLHDKPVVPGFGLLGIDDATVASFREAPDTSLTFADFGGLADVVARARELVELSLERHDALNAIGARPIKGVLFTGDPGTGKTMLARIIASQTSATFYEISGPEVFSKWYGESEELLRRIFDDAADQQRSIIFFDEIDSVAAQRADDAHEASRRVVAQLLTLMDGFKPKDNVVVIAATNRVDAIDVALRRPGRFDWEIHFPMPSIHDREEILRASSRHVRTVGDLPHEAVAAATDGWSGAMLSAIWSEAALLAVQDGRNRINANDYIGGLQRVALQPRPVRAIS